MRTFGGTEIFRAGGPEKKAERDQERARFCDAEPRAMMGDFVTIIHSLVAHPIARGRCCPSLGREGIHRPL